jgi:uncharacterized protein YqjF (DUF2071 family)
MVQTWEDLCFLHLPAAPSQLAALVPAPLALDLFEGEAWLSMVPFRMRGIRLRGLPPLPGLRSCLELNLRTYVRHGDRPGVMFLALEASHPLVVAGGRAAFALPYHLAAMRCRVAGGAVEFRSHRTGRPDVVLDVRYEPLDTPLPSARGSRAHFLTERYCLFASRRGKLLRADIHHLPWRLQACTATVRKSTLLNAHGLEACGPPLLHFARRQRVLIWSPQRVA